MSNNVWKPIDQSDYEIEGIPEGMTPKEFVEDLVKRIGERTMKVLYFAKNVRQNHSPDFIHQMIKKYINPEFTQEDTMDLLVNEILYDWRKELPITDRDDDELEIIIFYCCTTDLIILAESGYYGVTNNIRLDDEIDESDEKTGLSYKTFTEWRKQKQ